MNPSFERDRIVASLRAESTRIIAAANDAAADREAARLREQLEYSSQDQPALTALAWHHWLRVCTMSQGAEGDRDADFAAMATVLLPCLLLAEDIADLPAAALSVLAERIPDPIAARRELGAPVDESDPNEVAALHMRMLQVTPPASPHFLPRLKAVRDALKQDFARTHDPEVLDRLVLVTSGSIGAVPPGHPGRAAVLTFAAGAVTQRFEKGTAQDGDLDAAVDWSREALAHTETGSLQRHRTQAALAAALSYRAQHTGPSPHAAADAQEAVRLFREVEASEFENPRRLPSMLVIALLLLPDKDAVLDELLDALERLAADDRDPAGPELVPAAVAQIATELTATGEFDVARVAAFARRALDLPGLDEETTQALRMALELAAAYEFTRQVAAPPPGTTPSLPEIGDLDRLGDLLGRFGAMVGDDPEMSGEAALMLSELNSLRGVLSETDPERQLDLLIANCRSALDAMGVEDRVAGLSELGDLLLLRFARDETRFADLDEAVALLGEAMALAATPEDSRKVAVKLVMALVVRYHRRGNPADLDQASALGREFGVDGPLDENAVADQLAAFSRIELPPPGFILQPSPFSPNAAAAQLLPEHAAHLESLLGLAGFTAPAPDDDIAEGLGMVPKDVLQAMFTGLGDLSTLFEGGDGDFEESLAVIDRRLAEFPEDSYNYRLIALARFMVEMQRAIATEDPDRIAAIIEAGTELLENGSLPENVKPALKLTMAHAQRMLLQITERDGLADRLGQAREPESLAVHLKNQYDVVSNLAIAPALRIQSALAAAKLAKEAGRVKSAGPFLAMAVSILPLAAARHVRPDRRLEYLRQFSGITADAVALALSSTSKNAPSTAGVLRLLEGGRAVLQNQIIGSRRELDDLRRTAPELAARFESVAAKLNSDDAAASAPVDREWRHRAAEELREVTVQIRAVEGFADFDEPPTVERLRQAAGEGPIVTLNLSRFGSHALIARTDGIERLPLPEADLTSSTAMVNLFIRAIEGLYGPDAEDFELADRHQRHVLGALTWVHNAITGPVLDHLGSDRQAPEDCPRLWWAPGGLLGLLPLHAAGDYDAPDPVLTADRVVSSYTPTIRHLLYSRSQAAKAGTAGLQGFAAAVERTPGGGYAPLPYAGDEVARLRRSAPGVFSGVLLNEQADRAAVLERLEHSDIAHFICHARNDADNPAASGIVLHDHGTAPLTVGDLSQLRLERRRLAYLSACRTAQATSATLLDESLHLAAACQVAGFPYVVGTLWPVLDRHSPEFAERFYTALGEGGGFDLGRSATAVHKAQALLRSQGLERAPHMWASWLHYGA
ncbi:CHAT domain-containing protein [Glycomyces sp. NPDC021274]|uniref:CHAT domain-containing protein n=1 Tax=Glycomyces sp. NPDC021274 TaxID=3155120 RepID=UPI0033EFBC94